MKVLFLTQMGEQGPSSRYRVYQLLSRLKKRGIEGEVSPAIEGILYDEIYSKGLKQSRWKAIQAIWKKRQEDIRRLSEFDVVFVQKGVLPGLYSGIEKKIARTKPIVFDFDDAIWLPRQGGSRLLRFFHREGAVRELLHLSSAVIAGNDFLADYASGYNSHVTVIPTAIDCARYQQSKNSKVVGWIGSQATLPYVKPLQDVFQKLSINIRIIAAGSSSYLGRNVDFKPWRLDTEVYELSQLGIGISPLPNTFWEQGKCGVKLLQYMACGMPVVASPVGVHNKIVRHGENGYFADSDEEWISSLSSLMEDAQLRSQMGSRGQAFVQQNYDINLVADKVASVLLKVGT